VAYQDFALANGLQIADNVPRSPVGPFIQEPAVMAQPKDDISSQVPLSGDASFADLISRSQAGDARAMEAIYHRLKTPLFNLAFRYTFNRVAAEDLLQEIFLKVFSHLEDVQKADTFVGWVYRIALNTCYSYLRANKAEFQKTVSLTGVESAIQDTRAVSEDQDAQKSLDRAIETKYPEQRFRRGDDFSVRVDYEIWIPDKAGAKIRCVSGNVSVENIGGPLEGDVTSGNLVVVKAGKGVDFKTISGTTELHDIVGDVNLKVVSGNLTVEKIMGSFEAESTSGNIKVREISGTKSFRAKVLSGNITYEGQIIKDGKYDMEAMSGGIELRIPADSAFDLEAEAFSGHIETDFAVTMSGRISKNDLRGVVNGGGASVHLKTFSGSVRIFKR